MSDRYQSVNVICNIFFDLRYLIQISLFITYFGTCSVYAVIVAKNFNSVINHYLKVNEVGYQVDDRMIILALLLPMILLSWVPDLKYLAPVSMIANFLMSAGLGITFYYLCMGINDDVLRDWQTRTPAAGAISEFPIFFSITIFAMEAIGKEKRIQFEIENIIFFFS